jgi:NADPH:quinone reductase-like Zn-dependent oxidoreductase
MISKGDPMNAFVLPAFDEPPTLADIPTPEAGPGELLVRVRAASVNGIDLSIASGRLQGMLDYDFPVCSARTSPGPSRRLGRR